MRLLLDCCSGWLTAYIDANGPVAHREHVHLGIPLVGAELLGEEVAQLLHREAFHVKGTQAGEIQGAVGANREASAQFGQIEQLDLEAIAGAENVGVVGRLKRCRPLNGRTPTWLRCAWTRWLCSELDQQPFDCPPAFATAVVVR
jgi:hypothetical protein